MCGRASFCQSDCPLVSDGVVGSEERVVWAVSKGLSTERKRERAANVFPPRTVHHRS